MCENSNRFYICEHCGNMIGMIHDAGVPMMCCGQKMTKLEPGTVDASREKHLPVVAVEGDTVKVSIGSVAHPMAEEHHIVWVYLQTDRGGQRKCLCYDGAPEVAFALKDEKPVAVYAYCNLHGLWMTEL
ncbi:MAG: desulfoferrodoxin [Clostridia bacterium]|nr:desulfoferrodoxin [Clostridia bacterium]